MGREKKDKLMGRRRRFYKETRKELADRELEK